MKTKKAIIWLHIKCQLLIYPESNQKPLNLLSIGGGWWVVGYLMFYNDFTHWITIYTFCNNIVPPQFGKVFFNREIVLSTWDYHLKQLMFENDLVDRVMSSC